MRNIKLLFQLAFLLSILFYLFSFKKVGNKYQNEKNEALDALQFLSLSRSYPNADVPADAYMKAYDFYKKNFTHPQQRITATANQWQNIGPVNVGGRTLCIAIDPVDTAVVWLGSASGGLWKSNTGGIGFDAWTYVPTGKPVLGVSSIAIQKNNSQVMYIGTGETYNYGTSTNGLIDRTTRGTPGIGILKTTDGGNTWNYSLNWSYAQIRGVWEILINPKNANVLYAATTEGVFKSTDAGASWNNVLNVQMAMDIAIDKVDTNIVYACAGNFNTSSKGIYKTTNSGNNWNLLGGGLPAFTNDGRISLSLYENNNKIMIAQIANMYSTAGIYTSINEGVTWTPVNITSTEIVSYQGWYSTGLLIKSNDSTHVLSGGVELFSSSNSGNTFSQVSNLSGFSDQLHSDIHAVIANPKDPNKIYIATDGGLFRSDNFGTTFAECANGYITAQCYIGSISSTDTTVLLTGLQDNNTIKYNNNNNWNAVLGGDGSFNSIDPDDDFNQVCSYQYLNVYKCGDQGFNFFNVLSNLASPTGGNNAAFLAPFVHCPSNTAIMYGGSDQLWKSFDGGGNWTNIGPAQVDVGNKIISIAVSTSNEDSLYIATAPENGNPMHVYRSTNGGTSFVSISTGLPNRYPRRIAVNPKNSKELYIVYSGFGAGHVFKSVNAGNTWTDVSSSLPDIPFHSILVNPSNPDSVFAGCDFGMFVSPDRGATWSACNDGFPEPVMVFDMVYAKSTKTLFAFTHGSGVFKKELGLPNGVQKIQTQENIQQIKAFPVPADQNVTIECSMKNEETIQLSILDIQGRVMLSEKRVLQKGRNVLELSTTNLNSGLYTVSLRSLSGMRIARLLIAH